MPKQIIIDNITLVTSTESLSPKSVLVTDGIIEAIADAPAPAAWLQREGCQQFTYSPDCCLLPGFIDTHIHGIANADVMDATEEALNTLCQTLPATGTTAFLATTLSAPIPAINAALDNIANYSATEPGAEILGIHLEGPFLNPDYHGAHPSEFIIPATMSLLQDWQHRAKHKIKCVTFAPEMLDDASGFIHQLHQGNIIPAIGHSGANLDQTEAAIRAGANHITHLFNAMGCQHHRDPGLSSRDCLAGELSPAIARAALNSPQVKVELIVDNTHLHPKTVNSVYQLKGPEGIILITDAMRASCCGDGKFRLGTQNVNVQAGLATLADGTLAGSVLTLASALQNMRQITDCSLSDIVKMTAENPAKQCHVFDRKGSIELGKDADLVILDRHMQIALTLTQGAVAYQKKA